MSARSPLIAIVGATGTGKSQVPFYCYEIFHQDRLLIEDRLARGDPS